MRTPGKIVALCIIGAITAMCVIGVLAYVYIMIAFRLGPVHKAAIGGEVATLERLIASGQDINQRTKHSWGQTREGTTPLMFAAEAGQAAVVKWLLEHGADISLQDQYGKTAHDYAASAGMSDIIWILDQHNQ